MKSLYRILSVLFLSSLVMSGCADPIEEIPVTISLNKGLMTALPVGGEQKLVATVKPEGADVTVVWKSDNEAVAVVDADGLVKGVSVGEATVTAAADGASAQCKVTVVAVRPTDVKLDCTALQLKAGDRKQLTATLTPAGAVADDLEWIVDNREVATVANGLVTAVGEGEAKVTVRCNDGDLAAVCRITVTKEYVPVLVTAIELDPEKMDLTVGDKKNITVTYIPNNAEPVTDLTWESSDAAVAKVVDGSVEALKTGSAVITARCMGGEVAATCAVTVSEKQTPDPGPGDDQLLAVAINAYEGATDIQIGTTLQLELVCTPTTAVPSSVTWSVDNTALATIDSNGLLAGVGAEKNTTTNEWSCVVVSVKADGKEASLIVRAIPRQADAIVFDMPGRPLKVGEPWTVNARTTPEEIDFPFEIYHAAGVPVRDGVFMSENPGHFDVMFALSEHTDLVYERRAVFSVDVDPYWVETVSIDGTLKLETGSSTTLTPQFTSDIEGVEPTYKDVVWKSSDESVVKVDDKGNVSAVGAGNATVTVTTSSEWSVPSGAAHKSATCNVTVTEAANPVYVGDYFYSDGTWSTELQSGKTVVGIVFATANATSTDPQLRKDYPECTRGLVVSINEYDSPISMVSGEKYSWNSVCDYAVEQGAFADMTSESIICGYSNTQAMKAFKAAKGDYSKYLDVIDGHDVSVAGTSTWYMPSQYELSLIGADYSVINERLAAVGDQFEEYKNSWDSASRSGIYWSSTYLDSIGSQSKPYILSTNQLDGSMKMHSHSYQVRLVFAF